MGYLGECLIHLELVMTTHDDIYSLFTSDNERQEKYNSPNR